MKNAVSSTSQIFVNQLTNLDFTYFDEKEGLLGQTLIVDVELFGELNDEGMVFDFAHVKKALKTASNALLDHKLIFPAKLSGAKICEKEAILTIEATYGRDYYFYHKSPKRAVALIDAPAITIEGLHHALLEHLKGILPQNVTNIKLHLREEIIAGASFRYGHGLKKHFGDCQRIAHGHRSKLFVFDEHNARQPELEQAWCKRWQGIYIVSREDIASKVSRDGQDYLHMAYSANEGGFELVLPTKHCEIVATDTTIELITRYISETMRKMHNKTLSVQAFEGLNKGSVCIAE